MEAINRLFTPEFRNRLDAIIPFGSLPTPVIHQVVQKFVMQLEAQLAERNVTFELSEEAIAGWPRRAMTSAWAPGRWPRDPGAHQEAARRRGAVRQAQEGRHGRVSVEKKEDGSTGLKLDASAGGSTRFKPKEEKVPGRKPARRKPAEAKADKPAAKPKKPAGGNPPPKVESDGGRRGRR
jgi:ATP-dependent Clp protease ATP-binding subunit ClpA